MSNPSPIGSEADARGMLLDLARHLRAAHHLSPKARAALADLMTEMAGTQGAALPGTSTAHLAEAAAQAARALHDQQQPGLLTAAKQRLEAAAAQAETTAPVATGVARRLIDVLSEIGI